MSKRNISATLDGDLLKKLDRFAEETERNRSWFIGKALESYFDELDDLRLARERLDDERLTPAQLRKSLGL